MTYQDFLARKMIRPLATGLDVIPALPQALKSFQRDTVIWALRLGRAAIFAGTGLGKTLQQLAWAQAVAETAGRRVLILTPLAVAQQTVQEAAKFDIPSVAYAHDQSEARTAIVVTNYDRIEKFDVASFVGIVLDECFAPGTKIDTPHGQKDIENIREGDYILNARGVDVVIKTHAREVHNGVKVTTGLSYFIASPNHPIFTQRGWVAARSLRAGDYALETGAAVRLVRGDLRSVTGGAARAAFLQCILLGEMADEYAGTQSKTAHAGGSGKTWGCPIGMASVGQSSRPRPNRADSESQSDARPESASKIIGNASRDGTHYQGSWRQWSSRDNPSSSPVGPTRVGMEIGICDFPGKEKIWLPDTLQGRLGSSDQEDSNRGGWSQPPLAPREGSQERGNAGFSRVDSIEILELGHPELDSLRDADGKLYFYDLEAERHPSFSVNGLLVHNSSIIKAQDSKTRARLIELCRGMPFRLCCTATPAPNDYVELGNHAEFLGILTQKEMLATWFVHDGSIRATNVSNHGSKPIAEWRLKGHAATDFWRWISTWAVVIRHPRDLGYEEPGYDLPPLIRHQVTVPVEYKPSLDTGLLFPMEVGSLGERLGARRESINARADAALSIIDSGGGKPWLIWCALNKEQETLERALGDRAFSVYGSLTSDEKASRVMRWVGGERPILISKISICGFGMNFQNCADAIFLGLNDSFEQLYQAIRRCWRFGQIRPVNVHMVCSEIEGPVVANLEAKEAAAEHMAEAMAEHMRDLSSRALRGSEPPPMILHTKQMTLPEWMTAI